MTRSALPGLETLPGLKALPGRKSAVRGLFFVIALLGATSGRADQPFPPIESPIAKVEVTLDLPKDKPYVGEMILLRMRSFIRADVVLDRIEQPPLLNFSWQQLGRDRPIEAMIDGFSVTGIERDLAIFPSTSGRLIIEPFTRHVTLANADNRRIEADFASKPIYVDVQNYTAISPPDRWWMPARSVTLTDHWSQPPDELTPGTFARRTITVEALGLTGDRLPPPPDMQAPGIIVFRGPVDRQTILTEDGPIARGTYIWDLRQVSTSPAKLPPIQIAWFDIESRRLRDAVIPPLWVALVGTLVHPSHEITAATHLFSAGPIAVGLAGFAWTAALIGFVLDNGGYVGRATLSQRKALASLRRRARFRDEPGFLRALVVLARTDPPRWTSVSSASLIAPRLAALDRARYGRDAGLKPALQPLAVDIRRLWLAAPKRSDAPSRLSLDGNVTPRFRVFDGGIARAYRDFKSGRRTVGAAEVVPEPE